MKVLGLILILLSASYTQAEPESCLIDPYTTQVPTLSEIRDVLLQRPFKGKPGAGASTPILTQIKDTKNRKFREMIESVYSESFAERLLHLNLGLNPLFELYQSGHYFIADCSGLFARSCYTRTISFIGKWSFAANRVGDISIDLDGLTGPMTGRPRLARIERVCTDGHSVRLFTVESGGEILEIRTIRGLDSLSTEIASHRGGRVTILSRFSNGINDDPINAEAPTDPSTATR